MKKIFKYILLVVTLTVSAGALSGVSAQHYVGVRGGFGGGTSRFYPKEEMGTVWGLYNGGVSWKYYSKERYVGGLEVDLLFMQQGYKKFSEQYSLPNDPADTTGYYTRRVNTIMLPIFWQPHAYLMQRKMRVFLNLGVTFSYVLSQTEETGSKIHGVLSKGDYKMKTTRDNRWGYGLAGGGGVAWLVGRFEVVGEVRYYIGYSDIMRNENKYETNPLRSPLDGLQGSVAVYYRFGKEGILSKPSKKVEAKMREAELKRFEKQKQKQAARPEENNVPVNGEDIPQDTGGGTEEASDGGGEHDAPEDTAGEAGGTAGPEDESVAGDSGDAK